MQCFAWFDYRFLRQFAQGIDDNQTFDDYHDDNKAKSIDRTHSYTQSARHVGVIDKIEIVDGGTAVRITLGDYTADSKFAFNDASAANQTDVYVTHAHKNMLLFPLISVRELAAMPVVITSCICQRTFHSSTYS